MCECVIDKLRIKPFWLCSDEEKREIIENGRPTPDLDIQRAKKGKGWYSFQRKWYFKNEWMCGCNTTESMYCWPCLLFSGPSAWTTSGVTDVTNFSLLRKRHISSVEHISCWSRLIKFGQGPIETCLSEAYKLAMQQHNDNVRNNRYVLSGMIDAVCYLARQEPPFRGQDERNEFTKKGNYMELLKTFAKRDVVLAAHLEKATVFSGTSPDILNNLISAVHEFIIDHIKCEVAAASFVSIVIETADTNHKCQLATVLRFVTDEVQERFVGFADCRGDRCAKGVFDHLEKTLEKFNCGRKLICQTYDGASVLSGAHQRLQNMVRYKYPKALFVHCYAHKLNLMLQQATSSVNACKVFFEACNGLVAFFSRASKRLNAFEEIVTRKFPTIPQTKWIYSSRLVTVLCEVKEELAELFKDMGDDCGPWDHETKIMARGYAYTMEQPTFRFLLSVFSIILPKAEVLFNTLKQRMNDIQFCKNEIKQFVDEIQKIKDGFNSVWTTCHNDAAPPEKRLRVDNVVEANTSHRAIFCEVIDTVIVHMNERFGNLEDLDFLSLLDPDSFPRYQRQFPKLSFESLRKVYGDFDFTMLRIELEIVYSDTDYRQLKSVAELHEFFGRSGVGRAVPEVFKLAGLILTFPAISSSVEGSFSALKRIQTYLRNVPSEDRKCHLGVLSIEKKLLNELCQNPLFYDKVIDIFAKQTQQRINLVYK